MKYLSSKTSFPISYQATLIISRLMDQCSSEIITAVEDCSIQSTIYLYPKVSHLIVSGLHCTIKKNFLKTITLLENGMFQCFFYISEKYLSLFLFITFPFAIWYFHNYSLCYTSICSESSVTSNYAKC